MRQIISWICLTFLLLAHFTFTVANDEVGEQLSLRDFVMRLLEHNETIQTKRTERDITATAIDRTAAAFQSQVNFAINKNEQKQQNTIEEALVRQGLSIYERTGEDYTLALSKLVSTGAKIEAKTTLSKFMTNILRAQSPEDGSNYRAYYGVTLTQPLARDAGREVTLARQRVAELDVQTATYSVRDTETTVVAEAITQYYDLLLAQHRVSTVRDKVQMAERLLTLAHQLSDQGRLPSSDVWEVENSLSRFAAERSEAEQAQREKGNKIKTLLLTSVQEQPHLAFVANEPLPIAGATIPSFTESLAVALEQRDDFQVQRLAIDREDIQLAYANNQGLPRLDLVASYGLNGLKFTPGDAFALDETKDYPTWNVGLQLAMPLGKNLQASADSNAAALRKQNALLALHALEVAIANDIDSTLYLLQSTLERWRLWKEVAQREQQQLELEHQRLRAGRSDMREVLLREERSINARLSVIEQQVAYAKAQTLLQAAQGILLRQFHEMR